MVSISMSTNQNKKHPEQVNAEHLRKQYKSKYYTEKQLNHFLDAKIAECNNEEQREALRRLKF